MGGAIAETGCVVLTPGCEWVDFGAYPGGKDRALDT